MGSPIPNRNNEELKANIARIDKGKNSNVNAEVSKPMSKTPPRLNKNYEFAHLSSLSYCWSY